MTLLFKDVRFIKSASAQEHWPNLKDSLGRPFPEIAILGRSNVGKSTLLNHLGVKRVAKVSGTPGKTQLINFFWVDQKVVWVDLPGYGYAAVPKEQRAAWGEMVDQYLEEREGLSLFLLLLDCRRKPSPDDLSLFHWLVKKKISTIIVLTKVDKLNQKEKRQQREMVAAELQLSKYDIPLVPYSALKNVGKTILIQQIDERLKMTREIDDRKDHGPD
ncbi:MAG: engB [Chlamydiales bacterium]|jgi:GTP-binding protein|nr:engB [Chlamydiales bacterium]